MTYAALLSHIFATRTHHHPPPTESPLYFLNLLNLLYLADNLLTLFPRAKRMKIFYDKTSVVPMFVFEPTRNFKFSVHLC